MISYFPNCAAPVDVRDRDPITCTFGPTIQSN